MTSTPQRAARERTVGDPGSADSVRRGRPLVAVAIVAGALALAGVGAGPVHGAATGPAPASEAFTRWYKVTDIRVRYETRATRVYDLEKVKHQVTFTLGRAPEGWVPAGARGTGGRRTFTLADVPTLPDHRFSGEALAAMNQRLRQYYSEVVGVIGFQVGVDERDIDQEGNDLRGHNTVLRLVINVAVLGDPATGVRTVAFGPRLEDEDRVNNPKHRRIAEQSPLQGGQWIYRDDLQSYLGVLSRHPGRRVDVALSPLDPVKDPGVLALDYLVAENKPWLVFAQLSNTGTESTSKWRERFGFFHNQLTNRDDSLSLQYITAGFDEVHAFAGSYEMPLGSPWLRGKVFGTASSYTASDLGVFDRRFEGEEASAGGQLSYTVLAGTNYALDVSVGARWQGIQVTEISLAGEIVGREDFVMPKAGVSYEYNTDVLNAAVSGDLEWNIGGVAGDTSTLGRPSTDDDWFLLTYNAGLSFYLEPLLFPTLWKDAALANNDATLAHELAVSLEGQYAFDYRLIPQANRVAGGLYSVRGYPESSTSGDSALIARFEYRFHIPRSLAANSIRSMNLPLLGETQLSRQQPYGRPDWDLLLRAFVDVGQVWVSKATSTEADQTLVGAGLGLEFLLKQNLNLRADWGVVLRELVDPVTGAVQVKEGSNRFHLAFTVLY